MENLTVYSAHQVELIDSFAPSLLGAVDAYQNQNVLYRLQTKLNLKTDAALDLFSDTKRFLFICAFFPGKGPFSPAPAIDSCWHEFLMFTEDYQAFCYQFFGKFLHHHPFVPGVAVKPGGLYRSYAVAREIFGENLSANWTLPDIQNITPDAFSDCSCGGSCGGGCNG